MLNFQTEVVNKYRKVLINIEKFIKKCHIQEDAGNLKKAQGQAEIDNANQERIAAQKAASAFKSLLGD